MENIIYLALIAAAIVFIIYLWKDGAKGNVGKSIPTVKKKSNIESFSLRMQAYERLSLFLERSKPQSLVMRSLDKEQDVEQFQMVLLRNIREEFEHNFSQQIYISEVLWKSIVSTKDNLVHLINKAAMEQKKGMATAMAEHLLTLYAMDKNDYIELTLELLRQEARRLQQ